MADGFCDADAAACWQLLVALRISFCSCSGSVLWAPCHPLALCAAAVVAQPRHSWAQACCQRPHARTPTRAIGVPASSHTGACVVCAHTTTTATPHACSHRSGRSNSWGPSFAKGGSFKVAHGLAGVLSMGDAYGVTWQPDDPSDPALTGPSLPLQQPVESSGDNQS